MRKTVDATEEEYAKLADASKKMSTQIATSTNEINGVMATGGQLGIANNYLAGFTRTMIDLGNSCEDLDANDAATQLAKFANIMHTDQSLFPARVWNRYWGRGHCPLPVQRLWPDLPWEFVPDKVM